MLAEILAILFFIAVHSKQYKSRCDALCEALLAALPPTASLFLRPTGGAHALARRLPSRGMPQRVVPNAKSFE